MEKELNEEKLGTKVKKNQTAEVKTKSGNNYSYKYVDIAQIHDYLEGINARYIQKIERIETDDYIMTKRCFDNKWEEEWIQGCKVVDATLFGTDNPAQQQGSALTYARRYSLLMAFGLATEDDDAQSLSKPKEGAKATPKQIELINKLVSDKEKMLKHYSIEKIEDLTISQASEIISMKKGNK